MAERWNSKVDELVSKNYRLTYHIAKKYLATYNDMDELASIGTLGLIKAAQTFDDSKGTKFVTYACRCINNEILMFLRKLKNSVNEISLDEPINVDWDGNELIFSDILPASSIDFTEELVEREVLIRLINIILNLLKPRERLIMLYKIAGITQKFISKTLNISQSYISRLENKLVKKIKSYLNDQQYFKEVFSMSMQNDSYRISFSSKDVENFNKIFATFLQNSTSFSNLPNFNVNCNKERIVILLPADPESFFFIAQIIQEIDNFNMTFVSDKIFKPSDDEGKRIYLSEKAESAKPASIAEVIDSNTSIDNPDVSQDSKAPDKKESSAKQIINFAFSKKSFSVTQIREQFPDMTIGAINAALQFAKRKSLIKSTTRGNYEVITNEDETPENDAVKINS